MNLLVFIGVDDSTIGGIALVLKEGARGRDESLRGEREESDGVMVAKVEHIVKRSRSVGGEVRVMGGGQKSMYAIAVPSSFSVPRVYVKSEKGESDDAMVATAKHIVKR